MARKRNRVNISLDPDTYERLQQLKSAYGFNNACELVVAFVHILLDRLKPPSSRQYDLPEDEGDYISGMFDNLSHVQPTPDGNPPKRRCKRTVK